MREASKLVGVCRVVFAAGLLVVGACSPKITPGPVYDGEPAREKAMAYMGAPVNMSHEGRIVTSGPYYEFARKLVGIWMRGNAAALRSTLSADTVAFHGSDSAYWDFWSKGMIEHMLLGSRAAPKVVAVLIENLSDSQLHQAQLKWFDFPRQPEVALMLYSFDPSKGMQGKLFYPVMDGEEMKLVLEKPRPDAGQSAGIPSK